MTTLHDFLCSEEQMNTKQLREYMHQLFAARCQILCQQTDACSLRITISQQTADKLHKYYRITILPKDDEYTLPMCYLFF